MGRHRGGDDLPRLDPPRRLVCGHRDRRRWPGFRRRVGVAPAWVWETWRSAPQAIGGTLEVDIAPRNGHDHPRDEFPCDKTTPPPAIHRHGPSTLSSPMAARCTYDPSGPTTQPRIVRSSRASPSRACTSASSVHAQSLTRPRGHPFHDCRLSRPHGICRLPARRDDRRRSLRSPCRHATRPRSPSRSPTRIRVVGSRRCCSSISRPTLPRKASPVSVPTRSSTTGRMLEVFQAAGFRRESRSIEYGVVHLAFDIEPTGESLAASEAPRLDRRRA